MPASYESPEVASALTPHQIRQRYRDTSLVIFKEQQQYQLRKIRESERDLTSYLSFGNNRRVMTYNSNGNEPVVVHRSTTNAVQRANNYVELSSQIFRIHRKPRDSCAIT
ncbi:uncharacterized protein LOC111642970 isoform X1 [Copidosoma floridanum]|uniref:uncharacterized protein LOC111642970 isoform X1 n=1 Tax=Copidosoma floridanum TaxID=29053 RepID=UPI000C6FB811|nr:uncharacterized protein LOC111642970 isoform X1 [Copidosoma floridanum]